MLRTRTPVRLGKTLTGRQQAGRRVKAARLLAGGLSVKDIARAAGLSFTHLAAAIERGTEPHTTTDARDLAVVLNCPADWLRSGWPPPPA